MWYWIPAALAASPVPSPQAQGVLDVHEAVAEITGHVAVRCYVGEAHDTEALTRFLHPRVVDGWYSGVHRPDASPELAEQRDGAGGWFASLRLDWDPPADGQIVTTCEGRPPERRRLEIQTVDAHGAPVPGVAVSSCMESTVTGADGRGVLAGMPDFPCRARVRCETAPCHTDTDLTDAVGSVEITVLPGRSTQPEQGSESSDASPGPGDLDAELAALRALDAEQDFGEAGDRLLAELIEHYAYIQRSRAVADEVSARSRALMRQGLSAREARAQARAEHGL